MRGDIAIIVCMAAGIFLFALEAITPGLGAPGITGAVLLGIGTILMFREHGVTAGLITLLLTLLLSGAAVLLSLRSASKGKLSHSEIILNGSASAKAVDELSALVGLKGRALTALSPVGDAELDGERREVLSTNGYVPAGSEITVTRTEGSKIFVEKNN